MSFIAMEAVDRSANKVVQDKNYNANIQQLTLESMLPAWQDRVCECAELIALIHLYDPGQTQHYHQEIFAAVSNEELIALLSQKLVY